MRKIFLHCVGGYFLILVNCVHGQVVNTQFGPVKGILNGSVYQFLGIPYATPPTKELGLRWKPPQPPPAWTDTLQALNFAPACPQKRYEQGDTSFVIEGSEDCLYLNIWTPALAPSSKAVMVFIHGGGNQQGSAGQITGGTAIYHGKNLAQRGDVVVVTLQYRLGALGFLVHPGLEAENPAGTSGNFAVLDQILALQWIRNNIAAFGGDPDNITLFGESAGGVNVGNLMITPLASGLFHRAIIQSAAPNLVAYQDARTKGVNWVNNYISTGTEAQKIDFMRQLEADQLVIFDPQPLAGGLVQGTWQPVMDGIIFSDFPRTVFQSGNFNKVPLLLGSNSDEMSLSAPAVVTPAMVTQLISTLLPPAFQAQALALYPPGASNAEARNTYVQLLSDVQFTVPVRRTAECVSKNQSAPVWRYYFSFRHTLPQLAVFGAYHGMELFYVFNTWENATLGQGPLFNPADDSVQQVMLQYWTHFARTGNPNKPGLVDWPVYQSPQDCYLEIKALPNGLQCGLRTAECDFWDAVTLYTGCTSTGMEFNQTPKKKTVLYPNPAIDFVYFKGEFEADCAEIWDCHGKILRTQYLDQGAAIHVGGLARGMYWIKLSSKSFWIIEKLLIY
ncbi:MAG: carboxylesterase family protein [Flavobacteriales bacterium]|nr:carboxylesterase family protein [Flavobacteriales bacterium]MDW8431950.1 carboxylesterase family protein [Flavobacteriales bacterium]